MSGRLVYLQLTSSAQWARCNQRFLSRKLGKFVHFFQWKLILKKILAMGSKKCNSIELPFYVENDSPPDLFFQDLEITGIYYTTRHHLITLTFAMELESIPKPSFFFFDSISEVGNREVLPHLLDPRFQSELPWFHSQPSVYLFVFFVRNCQLVRIFG